MMDRYIDEIIIKLQDEQCLHILEFSKYRAFQLRFSIKLMAHLGKENIALTGIKCLTISLSC